MARVRIPKPDCAVEGQAKTFPAATAGLPELGGRPVARQATIAAMGSTGVYWEPVRNLLEGRPGLMPVNAREVEQLPGIGRRSAEDIPAEVGADMPRFPSADPPASRAGSPPGNGESAGERRSGRTSDGNRRLKGTPSRSARAAGREKDSYFAARHRPTASRRGAKRATMAVAHSRSCICRELLEHGQAYRDSGRDYFDRANEGRVKRQLAKRLGKLGYTVVLDKKTAA